MAVKCKETMTFYGPYEEQEVQCINDEGHGHFHNGTVSWPVTD